LQIENEPHEHFVRRGWLGRFHFENMPGLQKFCGVLIKAAMLERRGRANVLELRVVRESFSFGNLPAVFDGLRILFLSDLHIDAVEGLCERLLERLEPLEYDVCVLGGDYKFNHIRRSCAAEEKMRVIGGWLSQRGKTFAVLGNHDTYSYGELLEQCGVEVLVNEHTEIQRGGEKIAVIGVDDCHYYQCDDVELATEGVDGGVFKILVSHSPEVYKRAIGAGVDFMLCGHTHGGQICLPWGAAVIRGASVPFKFVHGKWRYENMQGYTSGGVGASGLPVRFNTRGEIALITLYRAENRK